MYRKALALLAAAASIAVSSPATAAPTGGSHCPAPNSGFVSWLTSTGPYGVDNLVDRNGNGIACAKPTDDTFVEDGVTYVIYNFIDDSIH